MFPVRYELNSYINLLRNSVFKGLSAAETDSPLGLEPWHYNCRFHFSSSQQFLFAPGIMANCLTCENISLRTSERYSISHSVSTETRLRLSSDCSNFAAPESSIKFTQSGFLFQTKIAFWLLYVGIECHIQCRYSASLLVMSVAQISASFSIPVPRMCVLYHNFYSRISCYLPQN
jgi:hypothetical protein